LGKWKLVAEYWLLRTVEDPADEKTYNQPYRDNNIGHEFDFEVYYAMTKKLTLGAEFDYLLAGDYNKQSATQSADNAWIAALGVKYQF